MGFALKPFRFEVDEGTCAKGFGVRRSSLFLETRARKGSYGPALALPKGSSSDIETYGTTMQVEQSF